MLYLQNRISLQVLALGLIDLLFAAFFVSAYITTTQSRVRVIGDSERAGDQNIQPSRTRLA